MDPKTPFDLLIQCGGCGIENLIHGFTPGSPVICNQCRENLLTTDFAQTHQGHTCDSCGMALLIKAETEFSDGESECQCGGTNFTALNLTSFMSSISTAPEEELDDDDPDFDWCRPAPNNVSPEDYNEVFDDDPGF
ncbi:MAG: hypothetical protein HOF21_05160 [Nitrospina sp.]|jgi:hypothetical protein|nr:hypothetical protein [Nitrospina sp.]MBT5631332.1 hypothetical protein [Nitrospina sp.]